MTELRQPSQITRICELASQPTLDRTAIHNGGSARGYPAGFGSLAARLQPIAIGPNLYFYAAPRSE